MTPETYRQGREALLNTIVAALAEDERVVAAWLTGSMARGEADAVSDVDLTVVIAGAYADTLCRRGDMATAQPAAGRLAFFARFGEPANVHENNHNAPPGGTFTSLLYRPSAHVVDWILVPHAQARRPATARLLFERLPMPFAPPPGPPEPALFAAQIAEQVAFFWMMAAVVAKYLVRGDLGFAYCRLADLEQLVSHIEHSLKGQAPEHRRNLSNPRPLARTAEDLSATLVGLCDRMDEQMMAAERMGITLRPAPRQEITLLLQLLGVDMTLEEPNKAVVVRHARLDHLLLGISPDNLHDETDWGASIGQEF